VNHGPGERERIASGSVDSVVSIPPPPPMSDFNMADMFGAVQRMQDEMKRQQEALAQQTTTAEAGGGMVTVTATGQQRITSIQIDRSVLAEDPDLVEDLIVAGVNKALEQAAALAQTQMQQGIGSMLPPGFDPSQLGL